MATFSSAGMDDLTQFQLGLRTLPTFTVRLYTNNYTPVASSTTSNFTECTITGYAAITLSGLSWSGSTTSGGVSTYSYPTLTFTFGTNSGATTVYGYFVTDNNANTFVWGDLLSPAYAIPAGGGSINLTLTFVSQQCTS